MDSHTLSTLAAILKEPSSESSKTESEPLPKADQIITPQEKSATIHDLGSHDRYRVLSLIEELMETQQEVDHLKEKLSEDQLEYREKRSARMKKLDVLTEKYERALSEIESLKESHSHSLRKLEEKISTVSNNFEASAAEIAALRKANAELKKENLSLRRLNCESTSTVSLIQEENSRLNHKLDESRHKEKSLKKQLKRLTSEICPSSYPESQQSVSRSSSALLVNKNQDHIPSQVKQHENLDSAGRSGCGTNGGGDCGGGDYLQAASIHHRLNTIKAPPTKESQRHRSTASFPSYKMDSVAFDQTPPSTFSSEDIAILENLFFRF